MTTLAPAFLIDSSLFLQVTRTTINRNNENISCNNEKLSRDNENIS